MLLSLCDGQSPAGAFKETPGAAFMLRIAPFTAVLIDFSVTQRGVQL